MWDLETNETGDKDLLDIGIEMAQLLGKDEKEVQLLTSSPYSSPPLTQPNPPTTPTTTTLTTTTTTLALSRSASEENLFHESVEPTSSMISQGMCVNMLNPPQLTPHRRCNNTKRPYGAQFESRIEIRYVF